MESEWPQKIFLGSENICLESKNTKTLTMHELYISEFINMVNKITILSYDAMYGNKTDGTVKLPWCMYGKVAMKYVKNMQNLKFLSKCNKSFWPHMTISTFWPYTANSQVCEWLFAVHTTSTEPYKARLHSPKMSATSDLRHC